MSMIGNFRRLGAVDLQRLLDEPSQILDYLTEGELDGFGPFADLDIDKAWHGIHFLLTGTAWEGEPPLNFIVSGGVEIGDEDMGYGPARGFSASQVQEIATALAPLLAAQLSARFDPAAMTAAEIYPDIWSRPLEEDDTCKYLLAYFEELRQFVVGAKENGEAMIVFLS